MSDHSFTHIEKQGSPPVFSLGLMVGLLVFTIFVVFTTEFIVIALLPAMAEDLKLSLAQTGGFVTWFALAAAFFGPPLTLIAGRCNPRHLLIGTAFLFALGNLTIVLMPNYWVITLVRLMQGGIWPAMASIAVVSAKRFVDPRREGELISRINLGGVIATVLGIPVGAMVADKFGWLMSFTSLALLGLLSAALLAIYLPRMEKLKLPSLLAQTGLLTQPDFLKHLLLAFLLFGGMFAGYTYIAVLLAKVAHLDGVTIGWILMGFGAVGVFGNWLAGRVADRDPLMATIGVAVALALAMTVFTLAGSVSLGVLGIVIIVWGIAHMAAFVINQVRVFRAGAQAPAFALSLNISVCNLGIAFGATLGGRVVDHYGVEAVGYAGALTVAAAILVAFMIKATRLKPLIA